MSAKKAVRSGENSPLEISPAVDGGVFNVRSADSDRRSPPDLEPRPDADAVAEWLEASGYRNTAAVLRSEIRQGRVWAAVWSGVRQGAKAETQDPPAAAAMGVHYAHNDPGAPRVY